ncbi:hypothetical protein FEM21_02110 [Flavobacterium seoulense]|uniref:Uncharacterized protein n=1 Tax=Flavobacterium seoulense TaxID=1492738 RepID=A0A066WVU3_9FLAO|nr:hypothetical protein FEM21_02110 [Flavobacterium seoulense]
MESNNYLPIGTVSGTFLSIVPNILSEDILKTVFLAVIGATVSFIVSLILKNILK